MLVSFPSLFLVYLIGFAFCRALPEIATVSNFIYKVQNII